MFATRDKTKNANSTTKHFVAHRGANNFAPNNILTRVPENTLPAFLKAYQHEVTYVECDIHRTNDNKIVVLHDDTIRRTGRFNSDLATTLTYENYKQIRDRNVSKLSYEHQLSQIDVGSYDDALESKYRGTKIPLLSSFLDQLVHHPERKLVVELKHGDSSIINLLVNMLKKYNINHDQLTFISLDFDLVKSLKKQLPNHNYLPITINFSGNSDVQVSCYTMFFALTHYHRINNESQLRKMIAKVKSANLDGIYMKYSPAFDKYTSILHENGLLAGLWTHQHDDNLDVAKTALNAGTDFINTNQPEFIFSELASIKSSDKRITSLKLT